MIYGGSPNEWWDMPPYRLAGFIVNRPKAEAYQSLRRVAELMTAAPEYDKAARQRQMDDWRRQAGYVEKEKPLSQKMAMFKEWGMSIEMVD